MGSVYDEIEISPELQDILATTHYSDVGETEEWDEPRGSDDEWWDIPETQDDPDESDD